MTVTLCDKCKKPADKKIIIPFRRELSEDTLAVCKMYHDEPIETKDLCDECFKKYKKILNDFLEEEIYKNER